MEVKYTIKELGICNKLIEIKGAKEGLNKSSGKVNIKIVDLNNNSEMNINIDAEDIHAATTCFRY